MTKISIIIPVYNVEKYLQECLESVCVQTLKEIEIICVNDCSPDNSMEILENYAKKDARIKIINLEENEGVARARNIALRQAAGEYIGFVDGDDYIDVDFFGKLYQQSIATNADVVIGNTHRFGTANIKNHDWVLNKIKDNKLNFNVFFWSAIYKSDFIKKHGLCFTEECIYGEDRLLPQKASVFANRVDTIYDTFYNYRAHESAITQIAPDSKITESLIFSTKEVFDFAQSAPVDKHGYKIIINSFLETALHGYSRASESDRVKIEKFLLQAYQDFIHKDIIMDEDNKKLYDFLLNNERDCFKNYLSVLRRKQISDAIRYNFKRNLELEKGNK